MPEVLIPRRGLARLPDRVEGSLRIGNGGRVEANWRGSPVVVTSGVYLEGSARIDCALECESLHAERGGALKVLGDLVVHKLLDAARSVECSGSITAGEIDVGGIVRAKSLESGGRVRVGRFLDVEGTLKSRSVDVGGDLRVRGAVETNDLSVARTAMVGGGSVIPGKVQAGARFDASGPLEFGTMEVYGRISLLSSSKGREILAYGRLLAEGDLAGDRLEVKGRTDVRGNCRFKRVDSTGKLVVGGSLDVAEEFASLGQTRIGGLTAKDLRIGGDFGARRVVASNVIELAGHAETEEGMKGGSVVVRSGSSCEGVLVGDSVEVEKSYGAIVSNWSGKWTGQNLALRLVGRETRVGDIYATRVHLGRASRCGRIFADAVELEEGCIAEEIAYTKEICGPVEKAYVHRGGSPRRVEGLPAPPL